MNTASRKGWLRIAALAAVCGAPMMAAEFGVVVVAHGVEHGTWNRAVEQRLAGLKLPWPVEVAFLASPGGKDLQRAFDRLAEAGVEHVVVTPLLVSSHSSHVDEIRYYVGLAPKPESDEKLAAPVRTRLPVRMTNSIDYDAAISAELCRRSRALSEDAGKATVLVVGHGPNEEDNNAKWLEALGRYAADLHQSCGFHAAAGYTLRDDAPPAIRDEATRQLRAAVEAGSAGGGKVIVMPMLIGGGGVMLHISSRLSGLDFKMSRAGLIESDALLEWLVGGCSTAIAEWRKTGMLTAAAPSAK